MLKKEEEWGLFYSVLSKSVFKGSKRIERQKDVLLASNIYGSFFLG